jgi:uncharacterized protein YbaA (DUF1428 family)
MALIFADGFDHYESADILRKWTNISGWTPTFGAISPGVYTGWARPPGGQGLRFTNTNQCIGRQLATPIATFISGFYVYIEGAGASGPIAMFRDNGTEQVSVRLDASGHVLFSRNGTTLATSTSVMLLNTWYHVEVKSTIHPSTGTYEVRVNGSATGWIPATTGANTRASANSQITEFYLGATGAGITGRFDDFYILDTTGSVANDFVGPQKIITIFPNAAGNYSQWTGNYAANFANVNELTADADSTVNQSSTVNQIDSFAFDDVPAGTITAIQHAIQARQDAGAARSIAAFQRSGSTDYVGTTQALAGSHVFLLDPKSTNPDTSAQWSASGLNAAEFGYKLIA